MTFEGWTVFAVFWVVFVTSPGPNAVNCIQNGMAHGFTRSLWGVAAILTQALLFLCLSALGITALIATSPTAFLIARIIGAAFLIWIGVRAWMNAGRPLAPGPQSSGSIYGRAFAIATINPKSVAGYLAAFSQFVMPDVPIGQQMWVIVPTALSITAASYVTYTALGAGLGRAALGVVANTVLRRVLAVSFVIYGIALGGTAFPAGGRT